MPKPYPKEFRQDVVRVARNREPGQIVEADRRRLRHQRVVSGRVDHATSANPGLPPDDVRGTSSTQRPNSRRSVKQLLAHDCQAPTGTGHRDHDATVTTFSTNSRPALRAAACGGRPRPADPIPLRSQGRDLTLPACLTAPTALRSGPSTLTLRGAHPCT